MNNKTLENQFNKAISIFTKQGNYSDFFDFFDEDALIVNEDVPFVLDKPSYQDHIEFLAASMQNLEWVIRRPEYLVFEDTGLVTAELTVRGKPLNHGFRQRHCVLSAVCYWKDDKWHGANLHTSSLLSHIYEMSPG